MVVALETTVSSCEGSASLNDCTPFCHMQLAKQGSYESAEALDDADDVV